MESSYSEKVLENVISVIADYRKDLHLTLEDLADRAGIHRTTLGLWERRERIPTIDNAVRVAKALGVELSELLAKAEVVVNGAPPERAERRTVQLSYFHNEDVLRAKTGLSAEGLLKAFEGCYETLDTIDNELITQGSEPISKLVELANLSSMIGNLLGAQIAQHSEGKYERNKPHTYPDLLPVSPNTTQLEIKIALEANSPKGHLAKAGTYLTFRYVLANRSGKYVRGKENRGDTAFIWEARLGDLTEDDFSISNTAGDSGKTAVIKTKSFDEMAAIYYAPELLPYAKARASHPKEDEKIEEKNLPVEGAS